MPIKQAISHPIASHIYIAKISQAKIRNYNTICSNLLFNKLTHLIIQQNFQVFSISYLFHYNQRLV